MDDQGASKFEKVQAKNSSLLGEIIAFMLQNKKFWLVPIMLCFFFVGMLALLSVTPAAPFIYSFF